MHLHHGYGRWRHVHGYTKGLQVYEARSYNHVGQLSRNIVADVRHQRPNAFQCYLGSSEEIYRSKNIEEDLDYTK